MLFGTDNIFDDFNRFVSEPNALRSLAILIISIIASYWLSGFVAKYIIKIAKFISIQSDSAPTESQTIRLRRIETYLSVSIAMARAFIVGIVAFYTWQAFSPAANLTTAAIGASAFFIVIASGTVGLILRDITAGVTIIVERWFDVGDFIRVEPFMDVSGVVERVTLRSTKLRSLNGEVVWLHNQYMQGVKVTPSGRRTLEVDIFMNNEKVGQTLIEKALATIPIGPLMVVKGMKVVKKEQWGDHLWLFTVVGQTPPGREWVIEDYFVSSLENLDEKRKGPAALVRKPMVRNADPMAERSFRRAVRVRNS